MLTRSAASRAAVYACSTTVTLCSRQDSNLHCLSTPGLSRVAKPFAYASENPKVRTPRVELGWDAYKTSWLDRSRVRRVGHLRVERSASSLSGSSGQPARHDPKCQRTDSNRQRTGFKPVASADWATLAIAGANGGIRTPTMQGLKLPPLPIGLRSRLVRGERIELSWACL